MLIAPLVWLIIAQAPTMPLTGTVVGPGGEPVVGADLLLVGLRSFGPPIMMKGRSGEDGRFSFTRLTALAGNPASQRAPTLWVMKPGFRISAVSSKTNEPLRVVLKPPGRAEVRVEGPDGQALSGVKVLPERLKSQSTGLPDEVAEFASATTGLDGLAVIDAVSPDELVYVDVQSRDFGIQGRPIVSKPGKPAVIALRPVSSWRGRLSGSDFEYAGGWRIRAWTRITGEPNEEPLTTGYVVTTSDERGRFVLAPIAAGRLKLELTPPGDVPVVTDVPEGLVVREGKQDSVDIPLKQAVRVTGLYLEKGTHKPVPGITVTLTYLGAKRDGGQMVKTDARGRYTFQSLPGQVRVAHFQFPPTHVATPGPAWEDFTVPEPPKVIEVATREALPAAPPLRGRVVDETGQAVPGATVRAAWTLLGSKGSSNGVVTTQTDQRGDFQLVGLGPDSTVRITAQLRERKSKEPVKVRAGEANPVTISIAPIPELAVAGRLLGPDGTPLAGIPVKVQVRFPLANAPEIPGFPEPVEFEGTPEIQTTADGTFRTPKTLERKPIDTPHG